MLPKPKPANITGHELTMIPRGDTCAGVNRLVIEALARRFSRDDVVRLLDAPCGQGELARTIKIYFPHSIGKGLDVAPPDRNDEGIEFAQADLSDVSTEMLGQNLDVVTCVSGVMEFDNLRAFLEAVRRSLKPEGVLYLTNDNILTVRDRLLYLFGGRFSQYPFECSHDARTWNVRPLQTVVRTVYNAGFRIEAIDYTPIPAANHLWAPIALPLYFIQKMGEKRRSEPTVDFRPYASMLSRHYVLTCIPRTKPSQETGVSAPMNT